MKTKLLSITLMMVLFTSITNAQTKVWDFANDTATWPLGTGIGNNPMVVDNLGLFPITTVGGNTNFGAVNANTGTFSDGFTGPNRFQMNGAGYSSAGGFVTLPTQRYLFIDVSGPCTIKVWFRTGGSGTRNLFITDGTAITATIGSATSGDPLILTGSAPAAGRYYIYGDSSNNLYKVSVVGATVNTVLSNTDFQTTSLVKAFTNGRQIHLSNVVSKTQVEVYSVTGALIRTINTEADTSFDVLNAGVYILRIKSEEGQKSVKLVVQ
jgi:hypothetical protein